jgi:hypothetical protein
MVRTLHNHDGPNRGSSSMRPRTPRRLERLLTALAAQVGTLPTLSEPEARHLLGLPIYPDTAKGAGREAGFPPTRNSPRRQAVDH